MNRQILAAPTGNIAALILGFDKGAAGDLKFVCMPWQLLQNPIVKVSLCKVHLPCTVRGRSGPL
jgi:hypothetical protein